MDQDRMKARAEGLKAVEPHRRAVWIPFVGDGDPGPVASKYFGSPWLAEGEAWPRADALARPMRFVLQLDVASLPEPMSRLLGGTGLLQLFYNTGMDWWPDPKDDDWMDRLSVVRLVRPDLVDGGPREQPQDVDDEPRQARTIRSWEEGTDLPHGEHYEELGIDGLFDELEERFDLDVTDMVDWAYQGDKLGGWPYWTQDNATPTDSKGEPMEFVYQIDAGSFADGLFAPAHAPSLFASDGTGQIFVSRTDPSELKFVWACT